MIADPLQQEALEELARPATFARAILRADLWAKQEEICLAIEQHDLVCVKACHSSGKTFLSACLVHWYLNRYSDAIVITTAPTGVQVKHLLWGDVHKLERMGGLVYFKSNEREIQVTRERQMQNYAFGFSTDEAVRFQGFHSAHLLIILDEAVGIRPEIWEAIEGMEAGGEVKVLALGNPTETSGVFRDCFEPESGWYPITISAFDTPNLQNPETGRPFSLDELLALSNAALRENPYPYLTKRSWVKRMWTRHGPQHPRWQARVMAQFPDQAGDSLIPLGALRQARARGLAWDGVAAGGGLIEVGIDVGAGGEDDTGLCIRRGDVILADRTWPDLDASGAILKALEPYRAEILGSHRRRAIKVDAAGVGHHLATVLEQAGYRGYVERVLGAYRPSHYLPSWRKKLVAALDEHFDNLAAKLYWDLRERYLAGRVVGLGLTEEAIRELGGLRWRETSRTQKVAMEPKDSMKRRGVKSPNRADAQMLAFAELAAPSIGASLGLGTIRLPVPGRVA